jgi:hypothetical protein
MMTKHGRSMVQKAWITPLFFCKLLVLADGGKGTHYTAGKTPVCGKPEVTVY